MKRWTFLLAVAALLPLVQDRAVAADRTGRTAGSGDCSFQVDPDEFLNRSSRVRNEVYERGRKIGRAYASDGARLAVSAAEIPRRNFIDDEIVARLIELKVSSAPVSTDEEFFRRIHLDLTGHPPSPDEVRAFLNDTAANKRDQVIDRLLYSPQFTERWTMWMGDLLQNNAQASNVSRGINGRNAFHDWIRLSVGYGKSLRDIASEAVTLAGNSYDNRAGASNFAIGALTGNGPAQDTYDAMLVRTATAFLGVAHYDCLLCHDGRRHVDQLNLWAGRMTRADAQRMAAFFTRQRIRRNSAPQGSFYYQSFDVSDAPNGNYALNTNYGNRPARTPIGATTSLTPEYRLGQAKPSSGDWRAAFAENMVRDPLFAVNFANRIWKQLFGLGLVDPVDTLDPDRLDPAVEPPAPWTLQPTHPVLLRRLAGELVARDFNLREFIRFIVQSSAYQLSSRYDADWNLAAVSLFARHNARRLEGEEIHDAIAKATGVWVSYPIPGWDVPATWAIQLPEPVEPRGNRVSANFMNVFLRGNRDTQQRSQDGSIQQQLTLMNDPFVLNRLRVGASPVLQAVAALPTNNAVLEELFLLFLSRRPTEHERAAGLAVLDKATTPAARNAAVEDLAWACVNKTDFLFSY